MPTYNYTALDNDGKKKKGILSATSEREARKLVKGLNLTPLNIFEPTNFFNKSTKIKSKDIVIMTRQLATLLEASTPIIDAIKPVAANPSGRNIKLCDWIVYAIAIDAIIDPQ